MPDAVVIKRNVDSTPRARIPAPNRQYAPRRARRPPHSMFVVMMKVGKVPMRVGQRSVPMPMGVRFAQLNARRVIVLMMFIVNVAMLVLERIVIVFMLMGLAEMQVHPRRHEQRCGHQ